MCTKKRGITLIELIITIAILSIVLSVISSFFFTNNKTLSTVNKDLELQSQGEKAINFMMDNIIDGYKVIEVKAVASSDASSSTETEITQLVINKDTYTAIFELQNRVLYYGKGTLTDTDGEANGEICNSIKSIKVTPLPLGKSFSNCTGLRIKIAMELDKIEKVFVNEVYMRNTKGAEHET